MEQSAISHQLRVLREHSLVQAERHGKRRVYRLYDEAVRELLAAALRHLAHRHPGRRPSGARAVATSIMRARIPDRSGAGAAHARRR
jgi:hypothetical protein